MVPLLVQDLRRLNDAEQDHRRGDGEDRSPERSAAAARTRARGTSRRRVPLMSAVEDQAQRRRPHPPAFRCSGRSASAADSRTAAAGCRSTSPHRPMTMPIDAADQQIASDARIAHVAREQPCPSEDAVRPEAPHVRFEREIDHPQQPASTSTSPKYLSEAVQSPTSTSGRWCAVIRNMTRVTDHHEQREARGAAAIGALRPQVVARQQQRRDRQRDDQQRRRARSARLRPSSAASAPCGSARDHGPSSSIDGRTAAIRRGLDSHADSRDGRSADPPTPRACRRSRAATTAVSPA